MCFSPEAMRRFTQMFAANRLLAGLLTVICWFWTAYECDTLGIEAFDRFTKAFPGELWLLAVALSYLTFIWMPKNLSVRALTGLLMLMPAELFKTTHLYRPPAGTWFAAIDLFVITAYIGAVIGMYGMFYPWRLEKGMAMVLNHQWTARTLGALCAVLGSALILVGSCT